MEKVLLINAGSSSLKTAVFDAHSQKELVRYAYERIGAKRIPLTTIINGRRKGSFVSVDSVEEALQHNVELIAKRFSLEDISLVAHRVVHGGEFYAEATLITPAVKHKIEALQLLAPLHNPINLSIINAAEEILSVPHVAVFDTAYHQTLPPHAYRYGIPDALYTKNKIRKYGFHGTSHKYLAAEAARITKTRKIITCHLGNGSSITANKVMEGKAVTKGNQVKKGVPVSIDTSMGFTPTDGLIMGTRSGALDPEVILYLLRQVQYSPKRLHDFLNHDSGLLGLSHVSGDVRDLWSAAHGKNKQRKLHAQLALDMLAYHIKKYVGAYHAVLGGAETIVLSGGIGENAWYVRRAALAGLEGLGIKLDQKKNKAASGPKKPVMIHARGSKVKILVIPANEELQMLKDALHA